LKWSTLLRAADQVKDEHQQLFDRIVDQCPDAVTRCQIELSLQTALKRRQLDGQAFPAGAISVEGVSLAKSFRIVERETGFEPATSSLGN
jgi:hypothetical protein